MIRWELRKWPLFCPKFFIDKNDLLPILKNWSNWKFEIHLKESCALGRRFVRDLNIKDPSTRTVRRQDCLKKIDIFGQLLTLYEKNLEQKRGHFRISRTIFKVNTAIERSCQMSMTNYCQKKTVSYQHVSQNWEKLILRDPALKSENHDFEFRTKKRPFPYFSYDFQS